MATVSLADVVLYDLWPGIPNPNLGIPSDGWDGTSHSCVTKAVYQQGTKIMAYNDSTRWPGWYTMMYLQFHDGTDLASAADDPSKGYAACFRACGTATADGSISGPFVVTNDLTNSDGTTSFGVAFAAADLSSDQFGWFWVGGVNPSADATRLAGEIKTNGDIKIGDHIFFGDDGTNCGAIYPYCPTALAELTNYGDVTLSFGPPAGYSLQVDA